MHELFFLFRGQNMELNSHWTSTGDRNPFQIPEKSENIIVLDLFPSCGEKISAFHMKHSWMKIEEDYCD